METAGYNYTVDNGKDIHVTVYTNKVEIIDIFLYL